MAYTDETPMPFGKYKGLDLEDVPASYLLWLYEEGNLLGELKEYIEDNMQVLEQQKEQE